MNQGAVVNLLIGAVIAILPLFIRLGSFDFQRTAKDNLLVVIFSLLGFLMGNKKRSIGVNAWLVLIYGFFILSFNHWNVLSIMVMFQSFYIIAGLFFCVNLYEKLETDSINLILYGLIAGSIIQSVIAIPQYFGFDIYREVVLYLPDSTYVQDADNGSGMVIGSLGNINMLASYLSLASIAILSLNKGKILIILPLIALLLNGSIMGILALIAGVTYFINLKLNFVKKWKIYTGSIIAMIAYPFSGIGHDSGRLDIWKQSISKVNIKHFLIGAGPGWFSDQKIAIGKYWFAIQEHNEFLSFFNVFGIVGIILVAPIFIKYIIKKDNGIIFPSILFAAFCNSYGHFSFHQSTVAIIIIVAACISINEGNNI